MSAAPSPKRSGNKIRPQVSNETGSTNSSPKVISLKQSRSEQAGADPRTKATSSKNSREQMLEMLLAYESEVRNAQSLRELYFCLANETLQLVQGSQIFILKPHKYTKKKCSIDVVSNLSSVDKNSPALVHLEVHFSQAIRNALGREVSERHTPFLFEYLINENSNIEKHAALLPVFSLHGDFMGAILVGGSNTDFASELPVLLRITNVAQHAWRAFLPRRRSVVSGAVKKLIFSCVILLAILALFIKVPLSTLAPVEIIAKDPQIIAAPINGVIDRILVDANSKVQKGTPLFQYVDTVMAADLKVAQQKWAVASAKLQTAQQNSFGAGEGRRDITIADAELRLAEVELDFAQTQFAQSVMKSPAAGVAVFNRKTDWQGKPVSVGERVLEIADISRLEARIDLAVSDAIIIENNARVQLFLDSNPLAPFDGNISSAAYRASLDSSDQLSFKLFANIDRAQDRVLRVGARGTAQVFGEDVTLAFYLFRRPLSAARQWVGW